MNLARYYPFLTDKPVDEICRFVTLLHHSSLEAGIEHYKKENLNFYIGRRPSCKEIVFCAWVFNRYWAEDAAKHYGYFEDLTLIITEYTQDEWMKFLNQTEIKTLSDTNEPLKLEDRLL